MPVESRLDTNIFVYAYDLGAPEAKRRIADDLIQDTLRRRRSVVSYQVVQEFLNVARGKFAVPLSVPDLQALMQMVFKPLMAVQPSVDLFGSALDIHARYQLSWHDALIVAAAAEAGCRTLYTEDLQNGARISGVQIKNPFLT